MSISNNTLNNFILRGNLYFVNIVDGGGSKQDGLRPCLIVSNNANNRHSTVLEVVYITSKMTKVKLPTHVPISGHGLTKPSLVLCEQISTVNRYQLCRYLGHLTEEEMEPIDAALGVSIDLHNMETRYHALKTELEQSYVRDLEVLSITPTPNGTLDIAMKLPHQEKIYHKFVKGDLLKCQPLL